MITHLLMDESKENRVGGAVGFNMRTGDYYVFRAKTVDITDHSLVIETTGDSLKIDALENLLGPMGLLEMVRSGKLIMKRGLEET